MESSGFGKISENMCAHSITFLFFSKNKGAVLAGAIRHYEL